jgi:hypothetical protein
MKGKQQGTVLSEALELGCHSPNKGLAPKDSLVAGASPLTEHQVKLALSQTVRQVAAQAGFDCKPNARVCPPETTEDVGQCRAGNVLGDAQAHRPGQERVVEVQLGVGHGLHYGAGMGQESDAFRGKSDFVPVAEQQGPANLYF